MEKDAIGDLQVPADAYWGISTQRALLNFRISGRPFPKEFIIALAKVKRACAAVNMANGDVDENLGIAMLQAVDEILEEGKFLDQFPIDMFQTGSGTQTNMNMNEVLANRANEILGHPLGFKSPVHPNDHANRSQSSNDVIPTAMHLSAVKALDSRLVPTIKLFVASLDQKIEEFEGIVKIGRTHLQDAVPIPLSLEFDVFRTQFLDTLVNIKGVIQDLYAIPIGGTALGTGLNAPENFSDDVSGELGRITGYPYRAMDVKAEGIASHSVFVKASSVLKILALATLKMANDIRWMGSGPRAGLGEIQLPQNEPGSSIMPGKVNPTQAESLIQVCLQVIGFDSAITLAEGFGSTLDLNVTKPLIIVNLLESIRLLSNGINSFKKNCLEGITPNVQNIGVQLERSLMIVTKLTPLIGYDQAARIAKVAHETGRSIRETIEHLGIEIEGDLDEILDPGSMV